MQDLAATLPARLAPVPVSQNDASGNGCGSPATQPSLQPPSKQGDPHMLHAAAPALVPASSSTLSAEAIDAEMQLLGREAADEKARFSLYHQLIGMAAFLGKTDRASIDRETAAVAALSDLYEKAERLCKRRKDVSRLTDVVAALRSTLALLE